MFKLRLFLLLFILSVVTGCSWFSSEPTLEERVEALELALLDKDVTEARLTLTEERVIAVQAQVDELQKQLFEEKQKAEEAVKKIQPKKVSASSSSVNQQYKSALTMLQSGQSKKAESLFREFLRKNPNSVLVPNAGYWLGESLYNQRRYDQAIISFQDVVTKFPKHDKAAASLLKTGYSYIRLGDNDNARFYLQYLINEYPKSQPAALAKKALVNLK